MKNNNRYIKLTQEEFELPSVWSEFMNDTMSIFSLMESAALAQDEEDLRRYKYLLKVLKNRYKKNQNYKFSVHQ